MCDDMNGFGLGHAWDESSADALDVTSEPQSEVIEYQLILMMAHSGDAYTIVSQIPRTNSCLGSSPSYVRSLAAAP